MVIAPLEPIPPDLHGTRHMVNRAVGHLVRWESRHGWTRFGEGWVAGREATLASTLAGFLTLPDLWTAAAESYLDIVEAGPGPRSAPRLRAQDMSEWNLLLVEHLEVSDEAELLERIRKLPGTR